MQIGVVFLARPLTGRGKPTVKRRNSAFRQNYSEASARSMGAGFGGLALAERGAGFRRGHGLISTARGAGRLPPTLQINHLRLPLAHRAGEKPSPQTTDCGHALGNSAVTSTVWLSIENAPNSRFRASSPITRRGIYDRTQRFATKWVGLSPRPEPNALLT